MLTYPMEERGALPLYEYLYRRIRADILDGTLVAGSRLPSKRALAEHLRVSVVTVEGAYAQLEAEGYLVSLPRRGFFVSAVEVPAAAAEPLPAPSEPPAKTWRLDLSRNLVDTSRFPVATWAKLTRSILSERPEALLSPVPHQGLPALRQAIAEDLRDYKGMSVSPAQIVVGAGAEYLYLLLTQLLGRDAVLAVEDPGYPKIRQVVRACGMRCVPVPLDGGGVDLAALSASPATALHVSPNHQYPTGLVTPIARRQALLNWAEERGGVIIEDDYDSEFRFSGRPIPPLQSIDRRGRVVYLNTFSQTISPSMRLGYLVLPPSLLARYRETLDFYSCTVPALAQHVLARFLSLGHYEQHLSRMRKEYGARRLAVTEAFRSVDFPRRVTVSEEAAGLHFLLRVETDESDESLRERAEEMGVRLSFLSEYTELPSPDMAHTLVINYGGLSPQTLPEALSLLRALLA
ncbi:MAG: PLP-dependent aminotransferase family protein [Oscillibacter sp.]|nr:PLP-dependent aminotransferase family protein [Oscillibacter sp.]